MKGTAIRVKKDYVKYLKNLNKSLTPYLRKQA